MSIQKGTITRRMENTFSDLEKEFSSFYNIDDFKSKLTVLKRSVGKSYYSSKLRDLFDMFDACGIKYERGKDYSYYENLVMCSNIPKFDDVEKRMLLSLYEKYTQYPSPEDYLKRIVDGLEKDDWKTDSLRIRILKQFIKYGNCLTYQKTIEGKNKTVNVYGGAKYIKDYLLERTGRKATSTTDIINHIDDIKDDIFIVLSTATKEQKKPDGKYGILKMVDDLASGQFRTGGATKRGLYLFAMVYDMSFCSKSAQMIDYKTDIEINLFCNYYINNLIKFLKKSYREHLCDFELDPSGQGINYKNYAEIIYLYYISKELPAEEKIRLSYEMIMELKNCDNNLCADDKEENIPQEDKGTLYYKGFLKDTDECVYCEDIFKKSDEEFKDFIRREYNCQAFSGDNAISEMQIETEQKTAYAVYETLLRQLEEIGVNRYHCHYGLWFTDVSAFKKECLDKTSSIISDKNIDQNKFNDFIELLLGANRFVGYTDEEMENTNEEDVVPATPRKHKTNALFVESSKDITRTSIIVAYYYYYNALRELDGDDKWKNFKELFKDFQNGVNKRLEAAFYQPFSTNNLFDVLIAFSAYAYHNI